MNSPIQCEDRVTLLSVPAAVERDKERFPETYTLCFKAVGHEFTVRGFNDYGMAELWINSDGTNADTPCADSVWIEQDYLRQHTLNKE